MKYQKEWNLGLLYKNEKDPQIEKDIKTMEEAFDAFEMKYKGKDFISTSKKLLAALNNYEKLIGIADAKPQIYFQLLRDVRTADDKILTKCSAITQRLQKAANKSIFFELGIASIAKREQSAYLKDSILKHFNYFLKKIFDNAQYNLSEKEEKLLGLVRQTSRTMWSDTTKKLLSEQTVPYKDTIIPISQAIEIIPDLPKEQRRQLRNDVNASLKSISFFAEAEINALYNFKKVTDEERGYKNAYSSTVIGYENDEKEIEALVKSVTKYFSASKRYYKLHAKLLGEKKIEVADLYAHIGEIDRKFDFDSGVSIIKNAFAKFGSEYADSFSSYLDNGQIDVYPGKEKKAGGYCMFNAELPTFVFLNYAENIKSVETLAHEMGHAFHSDLTKKNTPLYQDYTISVAEVASTFFEQFVSDELGEYLTEEERFVLLHQRVGRDIITVMRQIACFNFEKDLHEGIRKEGKLSKEEMAALMNKNLRSYMGDAVELKEDDGYTFVSWSHIRNFFYVYSYAYGLLISRTLYEKWKSDKSYKAKIEQFLSAGGSMSPKDIFKSIGINTNEAFFEAGLKGIEADIVKLEKLAKKYKKI
jgi:oligoendopeptidase F